MAISISKTLNIQQHEKGIVFLLLIQSVFLGIFAGALDVGANALFLTDYSADLMPRAFMYSGLLGILITSLYSHFQKRLNFKLFTFLNLGLAMILTLLVRIGYGFSDDPRLSFVLLVVMGPAIIMSMLGFWGTAGRYFSLRDGKRLFGIIDTGAVVGMILAFYAVPLLMRSDFKVYNTILIGVLSLAVATVLQMVVLSRHKLEPEITSEETEEKRSGFLDTFRKKNTALMAFFVVLSVVSGFVIHYCFMWTTEARYPESRELTSFLGVFFGTMMIFTVIVKGTLYAWLMKNFGLKIALLVSPVLLLLLTVVASAIGASLGYAEESAGFTFFFLLLALAKLFNKSLKDSIESPSMKILYQSLDKKERFVIQARIDGIVNEITAFSAGLLMAGLILAGFAVIHFTYVLIVVLGLWIWLGLALYRSYHKTLKSSLSGISTADEELEGDEPEGIDRLVSGDKMKDELLLNPHAYYVYYSNSDEASKTLSEDEQSLFNNAYQGSFMLNNYKLKGKLDDGLISKDADQRIAALAEIARTKDLSRLPQLITLLRDRETKVRVAAIECSGKLHVKEIAAYITDYLGHEELYSYAWTALVNMGEIALGKLENAFHRTGVDRKVQMRIVAAMIEIGGDEAKELLFRKIIYHHRELRELAVYGLNRIEFTASGSQARIVEEQISMLIASGAWDITAIKAAGDEEESLLVTGLQEEKNRNDTLIFALLALVYDRKAVEYIQKSIVDTEGDDVGYALELLGLIVEEQIFELLEPYFDDISDADKIRKLQSEIPVDFSEMKTILTDILNRDRMFLGAYVRMLAIEVIGKRSIDDAGMHLAAQVFNPDATLSSLARKVLKDGSPELSESINKRLERADVDALKGARDREVGNGVMEIVELLKAIPAYGELDREGLLLLARNMDKVEVVENVGEGRVLFVLVPENVLSADVYNFIIYPDFYPEILSQIEYIAKTQAITIYETEVSVFREIMFDHADLRAVLSTVIRTSELKKIKSIAS